MNPVTAHMPPALMPMMSGPTPATGVFQDLLNMSVPQADAPPQLPVNVMTPAAAPICAPAIPLALPPLAEVQNWTATDLLPQATAPEVNNPTPAILMPKISLPENSIEDGEIVVAEKPEASSPIDSTLVPLPLVQMRPLASAPVEAPAPPTAPQARKLPNTGEAPKPVREAGPKWLTPVLEKSVTRADPTPGLHPDVLAAPVAHKDIVPQLPTPLPAHNLGAVNDRLFSFETPSGINATQASVAPMSPPTGTPIVELRQLIIATDGEWVGALARDIVSHAARDNQLAFTLIPEHLGQLDIAVTTDNGKVDIRLEVSTHAAAQAIATEQARLIEDLRHAGLKLGQFDMSNRQNENGQQRAPQPNDQRTDTDSTPAQAKASSKAQGRFA